MLAEDILGKLWNMANRVDYVCDKYIEPPIKELERNRRGAAEMIFAIIGPEQKLPCDWQ
jgi:hypothetical protein